MLDYSDWLFNMPFASLLGLSPIGRFISCKKNESYVTVARHSLRQEGALGGSEL